MSMSKREFMEQAWIKAEDRLPNPAIHKDILTYNEHSGLINKPLASVIREIVKYMRQFWSGQIKRPRDGSGTYICALEITHWMPVFPPEEGDD